MDELAGDHTGDGGRPDMNMAAVRAEAIITARRLFPKVVVDRAVPYAEGKKVTILVVEGSGKMIASSVEGTARAPYETEVSLSRDSANQVTTAAGTCSCPVGVDCKHTAAVVITFLSMPRIPMKLAAKGIKSTTPMSTPVPAWEGPIFRLLDSTRRTETEQPVALQFDTTGVDTLESVKIVPVMPGVSGNWVRRGISWSQLGPLRYGRSPVAAGRHRILSDLLALYIARVRAESAYGNSYGWTVQPPAALPLDSLARSVWDLLAEAQAHGMPFVTRKGDGRVVLEASAPHVLVDLRRAGDALVMDPVVQLDEERLNDVLVIGAPAHGVAWWADGPAGQDLHLARLDTPPNLDVRELLDVGLIRVPARETKRFLVDAAPALADIITVTSSDGSVTIPARGRPQLLLHIDHSPGYAVLDWSWVYDIGTGEVTFALHEDDDLPGHLRDDDAEERLLSTVEDVCRPCTPLFWQEDIDAQAELTGWDLVMFVREVLPSLQALDNVRVTLDGDLPEYRQAIETPTLAFEAQASRDWLDLNIVVEIGDVRVPFAEVFRALASGESVLLLPGGTWISLETPEFGQLAELIAESRALCDAPPGAVRVTHYQASVWEEVAMLGVVHGQVAEWHTALQSLLGVEDADLLAPIPAGLNAELRPYQLAGFHWLTRLYEHGLGGVLADEMGLGKTLQAIALFCHARELAPDAPPFLVVAPTSVVSNWADEIAKFAPGLKVASIAETAARRGVPLAEIVVGADVVVTSYTLFRIDHDDYGALAWSGLVLDEAQFAKNDTTQNFRHAKALQTPFKLAISGTPMENNLGELWAVFALTAPGLFPDKKAFEEYYRTPIERNRGTELLGQLRRRLRPFMLRRTKQEVAVELPAKQEQILEVDLDLRHHKAYQRHFQRERSKVLGLLDDPARNRIAILASLTLLRQAALDVSLVDESSSVPSTKLDVLDDLLGQIVAEGHRVLVFCFFTKFLRKVRDRLSGLGIDTCYLDGTTSDRKSVIKQFKTGSAPVFLIGLKAGGVGLNLTEADYVLLLDPWWNPQTEAQAIDRAHRIGQDKPVTVYRLVARDTIEQKVMALNQQKAALFDAVMAGAGSASARLTAEEIRELLE